MTWTEQRLWQELRKLDANFRRQAPIGRYFADFATHGPRLVIEVDGGVHERLDEVMLRDFERQQWLEGQGYTVLRFTDDQVRTDVHGCVEAMKRHLAPRPDGAPSNAICGEPLRTPPSPALPPSRRKGA
jgi:very-short-patch-repair endonuclease